MGFYEDLVAIFAEEGSFNHVKKEIMRVTAGSSLGAKLFGNAAVMLKVEDFSAKVDAEILQLKKRTSMTIEEVRKLKDHGFLQNPIRHFLRLD